ncbi:uncharacterized protein LOC112568180 [Pomacea canaliculata]|uniref:uncharacterized protein LOC112568180 n=1 Tax=Pomacea canaliculata TaxID=400727 RepID=UPI000D72B68A|nr:uncharacterized protein LOC112568180 [Pomacea canaliculata]
MLMVRTKEFQFHSKYDLAAFTQTLAPMVHHPVTQVACRYPRKDLFVLTLKQTANTSSVRSADITDTCSGDMMFSACTFDDTCVTVKALVVGQGSEEFRVFECKATLKVNSESREIPVGQINITVGGPSTPTYTTTGTDVNESAKDFTGTCDSRDAPRAAVIVLVLLLIVFMVISAVLVIKIHRRTNTPCPCHVTRLCAGGLPVSL